MRKEKCERTLKLASIPLKWICDCRSSAICRLDHFSYMNLQVLWILRNVSSFYCAKLWTIFMFWRQDISKRTGKSLHNNSSYRDLRSTRIAPMFTFVVTLRLSLYFCLSGWNHCFSLLEYLYLLKHLNIKTFFYTTTDDSRNFGVYFRYIKLSEYLFLFFIILTCKCIK